MTMRESYKIQYEKRQNKKHKPSRLHSNHYCNIHSPPVADVGVVVST